VTASPAPKASRAPRSGRPAPRQRSLIEIRWRQWRNAPPPVTRAIAANVIVAAALAIPLVAYDLAARSAPHATDQRGVAIAVYVIAVLVAGSVLTYAWVPLPTGASTVRRRSAWSAALGFFAAVPVAYLVLVAVFQVVEPLLGLT
jgi:hypothetical protein